MSTTASAFVSNRQSRSASLVAARRGAVSSWSSSSAFSKSYPVIGSGVVVRYESRMSANRSSSKADQFASRYPLSLQSARPWAPLISWRVFRRSWSFGVCRFLVGSSSFLEMNGFWRIRSLLELGCASCWYPRSNSFPSVLLIIATSWVSTWCCFVP